jgi:hypothetical protein
VVFGGNVCIKSPSRTRVFRVFNHGLVWYGCFYVLVCTNAEPTLAGTNLHWSTYLVNRYSFSADRVQWRVQRRGPEYFQARLIIGKSKF